MPTKRGWCTVWTLGGAWNRLVTISKQTWLSQKSKKKFSESWRGKKKDKPTRKARNYKAVQIQRNLFQSDSKTKPKSVNNNMSPPAESESESESTDEMTSPLLPDAESIPLPLPQPQYIPVVKDDFVLTYIIYDFASKKKSKKFFVGKVLNLNVGRNKKQIEVDFLRRIPTKDKESDDVIGFSRPISRQDVWKVDPDTILQNLGQSESERRGRYFFKSTTIKCDDVLQ